MMEALSSTITALYHKGNLLPENDLESRKPIVVRGNNILDSCYQFQVKD